MLWVCYRSHRILVLRSPRWSARQCFRLVGDELPVHKGGQRDNYKLMDYDLINTLFQSIPMYAGCSQRLVLWWPVLSVAFFAMTHFAAQRLVRVFWGWFYNYKRMIMGHNNRNEVYHRVHCAEKHICAPHHSAYPCRSHSCAPRAEGCHLGLQWCS